MNLIKQIIFVLLTERVMEHARFAHSILYYQIQFVLLAKTANAQDA